MSSETNINKTSRLYFIALLPSLRIQQEIKVFKEEIKAQYGVQKALKLPAHITLQIPFKMEERLESRLIKGLESFSASHLAFNTELDGFGRFSQKVIFVNIKDAAPFSELHESLQKSVISKIELKDHEITSKIHPHITIATRDIKRSIFPQIWDSFRERHYQRDFKAQIIILFRHDGKEWHQYAHFSLTDTA